MARGNSSALADSSRNLRICTDSDDMISRLPDSIIGHILSFLPTKNAVATGILSKRWSLLWTAAINLDFCFPVDTYPAHEAEDKIRKFVQFVYYVLILHNHGCLNKFSLTWQGTCIPFHVTTWITAVLTRNVRELSVCVNNPVLLRQFGRIVVQLPIQLPRSVFSHEGLRSLELNFNFRIPSETVISLPKLESLKLISFYFDSEDFSKLIGGCPVLKYLYIDIVKENVFKCIVSSTSLKHLELNVHDGYPFVGGEPICCVELNVPSLEVIILNDKISRVFVQQSLSYLVEAIVELDVPDFFESGYGDDNYRNSFVKAVSAFECAKALTLSCAVIWALTFATTKLKTRFKRLSKLEVSVYCCYWSSLQDVIMLSDNLEVLMIKLVCVCRDGDHFNSSNWKEPDQILSCLSNSLKTVSVSSYNGGSDQLAMIGYILKHGNALKIVQIRFGRSITDCERKFELVTQISKSPRKSSVCELEFLDHDT